MKKILIVEDNEQNMYLINYLLTKKGYATLKATTGIDGIAAAIREKPDLILMDIQLPDIDGLEATKRIRESGADGSIPIIAVTSYAMVGDREKAIEAGCTGYVEKPINPETFILEMERFL
ncbi:MAG TPA: response regulator [Syntrophales bacterium]|nr:response regulator [Syntrophales bacterium]